MRLTRDDYISRYLQAIASDPGVVSYWPLLERHGTRFRDYRFTNHGTLVGAVVNGIPNGPIMDAAGASDFGGGRVDVAAHASLDYVDGPMSMEAWINSDTFAAIRAVIGKGTNAGMMFVNATGNLVLSKRFVADIVASNVAMVAGVWYHCIATKNVTSATKLYINGVDVTGTVTNQTLANSASAMAIGSEIGGASTSPFDGKIGHAAVYRRVLTLADARYHYGLGKGL